MAVRHPLKRFVIIALLGLVMLTATACAAARAPEPAADEVFIEPEFAAEAPAEGAAGEPAAPPAAQLPDVQQGMQPGGQIIIKTGEMDLLVQDTDTAIDLVTQVATENGGYVLSSQVWQYGNGKSATLVIAVLAENFETAMRRLRDLAVEVQRETSSGQDVTAEYVDLEARLRNLEATRDRVRAFLDEAQTVDEALRVNEQLAQIEGEIEQVKGRMNYLSGRAAYSTITVNLSMAPELAPTPTPAPWSLRRTVDSAVRAQSSLLRFLAEAITWLAVVLGPYIVALVLLVLGVRALVRRGRKKGSGEQP